MIGEGIDQMQNSSVNALAIDQQGNLIVGGTFDRAGNFPASNLARWNQDHWENLGSGTNGYIRALAIGNGGRMYVGGGFSLAGGRVSSFFAQYDQPLFQYIPLIQ